jgi:molybdopterin-containing oxidoreductase family membrane subunit
MYSDKLKTGFWASGILLLLIGSVGVVDRLVHGHVNANYGSVVTWGLWVACYIYFIGLSAGAFLISSMVYVFGVKKFENIAKLALFMALVTLLLALLSIWMDLGHMFRAWHVNVYPNFKSPMAWMIWLYSAYFALLIFEFYFAIRGDLGRLTRMPGWRSSLYRALLFGRSEEFIHAEIVADERRVKVLATFGLPLAIMFHGGVGALFGVVAARPHWHGGLFPVMFLLSALVSGGALLTCVAAIFQDGLQRNTETIKDLGRLVLGLLLVDVIFQVSEYVTGYYGAVPGHLAGLNLMIKGQFWYVFWFWQLGIGTIAPIAILASPLKKSAAWVAFAGLLIAFGFLGFRLNIVIPGLAVEEIEGLTAAISSPRITMAYVPSVMEWLVTFFIVGTGLVIFGAGELLLPLSNAIDGVSALKSPKSRVDAKRGGSHV